MDLNKSTGKDITKYLARTTQFEWTVTVIQGIKQEILKKKFLESKWKWEYNLPEPMGHSQVSPKR